MEIFINELSLHGQYQDQNAFEAGIIQFLKLFSYIEEQIRQKKLYKDDLLIQREVFKDGYFTESFGKIRNPQLRDNFRRIVFNRLNPVSWRQNQVHNANDWFICSICREENEGLVTDTSLAEVAERQIRNEGKIHILINFCPSRFSEKEVSIIKNDTESITLTCFDNVEILSKWHTAIPIRKDDFLRDETRFRKTNRPPQQGATVFEEIETGYFWYIDNFHKDHFEVFNAQGEHLGIANMEGDIIPNSQINGRRI